MSAAAKPHSALAEVSGVGKFIRSAAGFREIVSVEHPLYIPEAGRYHLYISLACPWANRCLAVLRLKGLEGSCIGVSIVHPTWQKTKPRDPNDPHHGWAFFDSENEASTPLKSPTGFGSFAPAGCTLDLANGEKVKFVRDLYEMSNDTKGKYSVPVLWDTRTNTIVNNESSEIIRMFTCVFDRWATGPHASLHLYPPHLRDEIEEANDWVYHDINDGVYKCGV